MRNLITIIFLLSVLSCEQSTKSKNHSKNNLKSKTKEGYKKIIKKEITGDFNGDGKEDKMEEFLFSSINNEQIEVLPQFEYDSIVDYILKLKPILSLNSLSKNIPNLELTKESAFGVLHMKNEGDLNNDGTDELSVVIDWADWSQINMCMIFTLHENKWIKIGQFDIREGQLLFDKNFNGFIVKNKNGNYEALTFDSDAIDINKPLGKILIRPNNEK